MCTECNTLKGSTHMKEALGRQLHQSQATRDGKGTSIAQFYLLATSIITIATALV